MSSPPPERADTPRYVPILKGRAGELTALPKVQPGTVAGMLPLIEVVRRDDSPSDAQVTSTCRKLVESLAKGGYSGPVMLDGGYFELDRDLGSGRGVVAELAAHARVCGIRAQPVLRLDDPDLARKEAADALHTDGRGLTIRLLPADLDVDPEDLDELLAQRLDDLAVDYGDVDLLVDLGVVDGELLVTAGSRLVRPFLRGLSSRNAWRSITVAGGAFPIDLSGFTANKIGTQPRYDAQLYDRVRIKIGRRIDFGDYAIAHPSLGLGGQFSPPPQLRYTVAEEWLVLKGRRNDPNANAQFHDICRRIATHPDFAGTPLGYADQRIAAGSPEGPGNGTIWRMIGTVHHLDYVTARLTTLGEP
jgi:hypothetical protein